MKELNSAKFRRNMYNVFNECVESNEPVLVTTNKLGAEQQRMVIISEAQYKMMIGGINAK